MALTRREMLDAGMEERFIVDRDTHPGYRYSSWPRTTPMEPPLHQFNHVLPNSVVVVTIGNLWAEGTWHRLMDMVVHAERAGLVVAVQEVDDTSLMPGDAIGRMRASAAMTGLDSGAEWLLMVDNDVLLEPDTLERLLTHDRPVVFPLLNDLEGRYPWAPLTSPRLEPNTGLRPVRWAAMSVMLFNPRIFNAVSAYAWHADDYAFGQHLNHIGHRIYVDTDTLVSVVRGPSRIQMKPWDEAWESMRIMHQRIREEERDRRPPPGHDSVFSNNVTPAGAYMPLGSRFEEKPCQW